MHAHTHSENYDGLINNNCFELATDGVRTARAQADALLRVCLHLLSAGYHDKYAHFHALEAKRRTGQDCERSDRKARGEGLYANQRLRLYYNSRIYRRTPSLASRWTMSILYIRMNSTRTRSQRSRLSRRRQPAVGIILGIVEREQRRNFYNGWVKSE